MRRGVTLLGARSAWAMLLAAVALQTLARPARAEPSELPPWGKRPIGEIGMFIGVLHPSDEHNLRASGSEALPFAALAPEFGMRIAAAPIRYAALELDGSFAAGSTEDSAEHASLYSYCISVVGRLPIRRVTPFLALGGGQFAVVSKAVGNDIDPALYLGAGVRYDISPGLLARLDLRDALTQKLDAPDGTLTHHISASIGLSFALEPGAPGHGREATASGGSVRSGF